MRMMMAVLYTALLLGANPVAADVPAAMALRAGDMLKLGPTEPPVALPAVSLIDMQDQPRSLEDFRGKWVVLNFWATWCAPCRREMPSLDRLQSEMPPLDPLQSEVPSLESETPSLDPLQSEMPSLDRLQAAMPGVAVVPVATGRNDPAAIKRFFAEAGVNSLTVLRDPKSELARAVGVLALPVTLILNPEGQEVARLIGDAEWDSPEALAVLKAMAE